MDYYKIVKRRIQSVSALAIIASFLLWGRLFSLQVGQHEHYLALAQDQQRFEKIELAQRGKVYVHDSYYDPDRYYPLAFDVKKFALWAVPHNIFKKEETAKQLADLTGLTQVEIFEKINNDKIYIPPLKRGLSLDEANKIKSAKINGVLVVPEYNRYYPEGNLAAHILGFVNADGEGKYGFEGHYNSELKGLAGNIIGEKDTLGRVINLLDQKDPQDGTNYVLTLDRSVQYFVEKKLTEALEKYQAEAGSVIIMDVKTGGIIAMASTPTYDPNNYRDYAKDNSAIYVNPNIAHTYEPGSIMKPIIMSAALNEGVVQPETKSVFSNYIVVDDYEIHTAEDKAFGEEDMATVLQNSDNVAMVWISEKLGKEKMYEYLRNYNFFDKTRIDLDTEVVGYAPALKQWRNIHRATISFGQGIAVTPIEMVAAYAAIANKGVYIYPRVVDKMIGNDGREKMQAKEEGKRILKEEVAAELNSMLTQTVEKGHAWRAGVPGFTVAAKTGTAQIPKADGGYEEDIYNHSLAGFAPAEDPHYAMLVKLEKPKANKYAEATAGPLFGEISSFLLNNYYRLEPTKEVKPLR